MPQLYIFIVALFLIITIVVRRNYLWNLTKKIAFKKKVSKRVDELKKEANKIQPERFKEKYKEQSQHKKFDFAKYKNELRRADMAIAQGNFKTAQKVLITAISLSKNSYEPTTKLAGVYFESGDLSRAETMYKRLLESEADDPKIFENLAKIYVKQKKYKQAIEMFVRAVELDKKNDQLLMALGRLYYLLMRYSIAGECFRRAAEMKPREIEYLFMLADCCEKDGDYENALHTYERIKTLEPYNQKACDASSNARIKLNEMEQAMVA